jgi:hypothetical protein
MYQYFYICSELWNNYSETICGETPVQSHAHLEIPCDSAFMIYPHPQYTATNCSGQTVALYWGQTVYIPDNVNMAS